MFKTGRWGTLTPLGQKNPDGTFNKEAERQRNEAIGSLGNMPHPFELEAIGRDKNGDATGWRVDSYSDEAKKRLYGSEEKLEENAGLYALLNAYTLNNDKMNWLWQPKSSAFFIDGKWKADEIASLSIPVGEVKNGITGQTPIQLMGTKGLFVSVEPIIWNPLRISKSQYSYGVYGTQTGVARAIDWLVEGGWFIQKNSAVGGYDGTIFGKGGRQAFTLPSNVAARFPAWNFPDTGPRIQPWQMLPPTVEQRTHANNKDTMWLANGISIHLYLLGNGLPITTGTSTCDEPGLPTPHPAPDPKDKTKVPAPETGEDITKTRIFNIVKTYRADSGEGAGMEHVITHTRQNNPSQILIEDERDYKVVEWFISSTYNNPSQATTWEENHIHL